MWMEEEEPQWGVDEPEEVKPEEPKAPAEGAAPAAAEGEKKEGEAAAAPEDPFGDNPSGKVYFRHWVRPKFLQYSYLYDYRKNYYDDVIDYLDRRSHGITRDIPRPQTWAERILRTYNQKNGPTQTAIKTKTDDQLIHTLHHTRAIHHLHTKEYYSRKFTLAY